MSKFSNYWASQCGNPRGVIGKLMTWGMNRANHVMYKGIVNELELQDNLKLLDIGSGNGYLEKLIMKKKFIILNIKNLNLLIRLQHIIMKELLINCFL